MNRQQSLGGGARGFSPLKGKNSFTLAEVLITLGIIGIVAALTLPTLIQKHTNKVVETRLMKFYSAINQAITLAEVDYGDREYWYAKYDDLDTDIKGRPVKGKTNPEKWVNKYLAPYMKITKRKYTSDNYVLFSLADGGMFANAGGYSPNSLSDWYFYTMDYSKCKALKIKEGVCRFSFNYILRAGILNSTRTFEPYQYGWDGTLAGITSGSPAPDFPGRTRGCNKNSQSYCTLWIQYNGWKIPEDYPFKVRY